jgi:hypothetical protein
MRRKPFGIMFAIAALAGTLVTGGCGSAAARTPPTRGTPAPRTLTAGGKLHFIGYSINSDGPRFSVILTGAIGDYGPAVSVHPNGTIDPQHTSELSLGLKHGSFRLSIASLDKKVRRAYSPWPSRASTCSGSVSFSVATPIVAGSGTGLYQGISGSINVTVTVDEIDVKPVCNGTSKFLAQVILIVGSGNVSFS